MNGTTTRASARVLVLRSCRPNVLAGAFEAVRREWPGAAITALAHAGHVVALNAQGVDSVIEVPGHRFAVTETPLRTIRGLRASRYDAVIIPQMNAALVGHANLYRLALAIGAPVIGIFAQDRGLRLLSTVGLLAELASGWRTFLKHAFDVPMALAMLTLAVIAPRRRWERSGRRRVLHVITSWGVGGAQRQLAELVRHCPATTQMEIFVLARVDGDFSSRHLEGHDVRIRYAREWPLLAPTIREIAALCCAERYDVVHTWLFLANVLGVAGARLGRTPRVISAVRNLSLWKRTWSHRPWFRLADALASRASDLVTVNAHSLVGDHAAWARFSPRRIEVVHNGLATDRLDIDLESARSALRARLSIPPHVRLVGTVGRMAPEKDHALLLDAWPSVVRRVPDTHLVFVGDGPLRPALETQARAERLPVSFLGESSDARHIMAGLDLFVLPSRIEGFANVLLEATMLGVPVLATDVGAAREVVVETDDFVPVADGEALANRLVSHVNNLSDARSRAAARRTRVRKAFTVDRMVERWLSLYDRS